MMRHHDHFSPRAFQAADQANSKIACGFAGIRRTKPPVGWSHANATEIRHAGLRGHFRQNNVAVETEIRP